MYATLFSWTQVEHFFDIFSSKLDFPPTMFWLEKNLILSNVLIAGESNFDEKNVEEVFNLCSTCVQLVFNWKELHTLGITCYKISTLPKLISAMAIHSVTILFYYLLVKLDLEI